MSCILPRNVFEADVRVCGMTASNELICFLVSPLPETALGNLCNWFVGNCARPPENYAHKKAPLNFGTNELGLACGKFFCGSK